MDPSIPKHPGQFLCSHRFYPLNLPFWINGSYYHYIGSKVMCQKVSQLSSSTVLFGEVKKLRLGGELLCPRSVLLCPEEKLRSLKSNSNSLQHIEVA